MELNFNYICSMIKLLNRYQSSIIALLCFFSMDSALAGTTDFNRNDDSSQDFFLEASSFYFDPIQIDHRRKTDKNQKPSEAIEYEKNDEEDSKPLGGNLNFTPATIFALNSNGFRNSEQELEKVRWRPMAFAWNLHASRSIFFQVFRV